MIEAEPIQNVSPAMRMRRAGWLLGILARPFRTMRAVTAEDKGNWHIPMLVLTLLTLAFVLVAGPLRMQAAQAAPVEPPEGFEYMSPEQQQQYMEAQASAYGTTQTYVFPAVGSVLGLWLGFLVLGGLLHLILTMLGSRSSSTRAYNIVGWASVPLGLRMLVQIGYMLIARQLIAAPGLSGILAADLTGGAAFGRILLGMLDIYLVWQVLLLWLGSSVSGGLSKGRALSGVLITAALYLLLAALPSFLGAQLSGMDTQRPFFLF